MNFFHLRYRFWVISSFLTGKKLVNLCLNYLEYHLGRTKLISFPRSLSVELNNYCNLHCPSCPTSIHANFRSKRTLSLSEFSEIVGKTKQYVYNIALGTNGEITLVPNIGDYIRFAKKHRLFVSADTNFNCGKEMIKKIYDAGTNMVNISLDGISQRVYQKYRIGGKFKQVIDNMIYLNFLKKTNKTFIPVIQWQYIVNRFNEKDIARAKKIADKNKFILRASLPFIPGGDNFFFEDNPEFVKKIADKFLPLNEKFRYKNRQSLLTCYQPFSELEVLCNGDVTPCCRLREKNIIVGNIVKSPIENFWNSPAFIFFRQQLIAQGKNKHCKLCLRNMERYLREM